MRELKFRGQTRRKGERVRMGDGKPIDSNWVYGGIFATNGDFSVIYTYEPVEKRTVYTDTVGQYTGLKDRNGVEIYEGDIIRFTHTKMKKDFDLDNFLTMPEYEKYTKNYFVESLNTYYKCGYRARNKKTHFMLCQATLDSHNAEVIGNIYDNPELLKE